MKERIKKFYKKNQEACVYATCLAIVATTSIFIVRKGIDGTKVVAVGAQLDDGVYTVCIRHKNGFEDFWSRTQEV